jgi:hypothetical protein
MVDPYLVVMADASHIGLRCPKCGQRIIPGETLVKLERAFAHLKCPPLPIE